MTFIAMAEALNMVTLPQYQDEWKWLLSTVLVTGSLIDLVIALSLSYYLKEHGKRCVTSTVTHFLSLS